MTRSVSLRGPAASVLTASVLAACALFFVGAHAAAQRRVATPAPATWSVTPLGEGHRLRVSVQATESIELAADRRLVRVEIRDARNRRVRCTSSSRPQPDARARRLAAGEQWAEVFDVRELCWGRALSALQGAREVRFLFDAGAGRRAWVVRTGQASFRSLPPIVSSWRAPEPAAAASGPVRVSMSPADAMRGGRPVFRVRVTGTESAPVRAFMRPENVSFRVTTPSGGTLHCRIAAYPGRALPDFFTRLSLRRVSSWSLDAVRYCGRFEEPGVYDVTPIVTLRERGAEWGIDAVTGTFEGIAAPLRIRSTSYVEQPVLGAR